MADVNERLKQLDKKDRDHDYNLGAHQKQIDDLKKMLSGFASKINQMKSQAAAANVSDSASAIAQPMPAFDFDANADLEKRIMEVEGQIHKLKEEKVEEETFDMQIYEINEKLAKLERNNGKQNSRAESKMTSNSRLPDPDSIKLINIKLEALERSNSDMQKQSEQIETNKLNITDLQRKTLKIVTEDQIVKITAL